MRRSQEILDHKWFVDKVKPMLKEIGEALQLLHVFTMTDVHRVPFDMAVLNAIVSSFKLREDQEAEAEARMLRKKELRALFSKEMRPHQSARLMRHEQYMGKRVPVSDEQVSWSFEMRYNPTEFTDGIVAKFAANPVTGFGPNTWADPHDLRGPAVTAGFESLEAEVRARSTFVRGSAMRLDQVAVFEEETGRPINPAGRTGMRGRGLLGRWGPNYAADPIVTRFQGSQLQMVAIRRKDTGQWAIPGGMVDAGEAVTTTLLREFKEEAGDFGEASQKQRFDEMVDRLFENGELVYVGYVDDPRNTDNACTPAPSPNLPFPRCRASSVLAANGRDGDDCVPFSLQRHPGTRAAAQGGRRREGRDVARRGRERGVSIPRPLRLAPRLG